MDIKNTIIDGKVVDIISEEEYKNRWNVYENPSMSTGTAVEVEARDGGKMILPFRSKTDDRPGIYQDGCIYIVKEGEEYRTENLEIVDFSNVSSVKEFMNKNSQIRQMESNILTDIDSVFAPPVTQDDSPEMRAFKEAIAKKHIDINRYAPRFGDNFLNDRRILKSNSITMNKLVSMCEKLDIEAEITLRDASPDIANPMGTEIKVVLTKGEG